MSRRPIRRPHRPPRRRTRLSGERGAAAVEFALVAPVLIMLLIGIVEFSLVYSTQSSLSAAAREGARVVALGADAAATRTAVTAAAAPVPVSASAITVSRTCAGAAPTDTVRVAVRSTRSLTVLGGRTLSLTGEAVMRCGG